MIQTSILSGAVWSLPDPKVVGVEELVLGDVLEELLVFLAALGRLSKDELSVRLAHGQVPPLLIALRPDDLVSHWEEKKKKDAIPILKRTGQMGG